MEANEPITATPTLMSERLVLRKLSVAKQYNVDWVNDRETVKYSELRHEKHELQQCYRWLWTRDWCWAISLIEPDLHIGNVSAKLDLPNRLCNLSIMIGDKEHLGKGLGLEAWQHTMDWILSDATTIRKVEAGCMEVNVAMRRIMEKSGMLFEGKIPHHFLFEGRPVAMLQYGRLR